LVRDPEWPAGRSAIDYYFLEEDGGYFKAAMVYSPYFLVKCKPRTEQLVEAYLRRRFEKTIEGMQVMAREDLDLPNHLSGIQREYLILTFRCTYDLMSVRRVLLPAAQKNGKEYSEVMLPM
jgi:DNA polymerase epsilon subunit 1